MHNREAITKWAKDLFEQDNWLILDTETTGLEYNAEIVELSIIDKHGTVLFDSLIRPGKNIPNQAIMIHGITNEMVKNSPAFPEIWQTVSEIFQQKSTAVIYNADFDYPKLQYAAKQHKLELPSLSLHCLMRIYAHYYGLCGDFKYCYCRWQKLERACRNMNIPVDKQHRAFDDATLTLELLKAIAAG